MRTSELQVLLTVSAGLAVLGLARLFGARGLRGRDDSEDSTDEPTPRHRRSTCSPNITEEDAASTRVERSHSMIGGDQTVDTACTVERSHSMIGGDQTLDGSLEATTPTQESASSKPARSRERRRSDHSGFAAAANML